MENNRYWTQEQINEYIDSIKETDSLNADLHNHTTGSDGRQSPLMILLRASNKGKSIVSMSDHNSVKGYTGLRIQILELLEELEEINQKEDITDEEKERVSKASKRILDLLEKIKLLPASELVTCYKGCTIEVLGYGVKPEILEKEIENINKDLVQEQTILFEQTNRIIEENNIVLDRYFIDNRDDFRKLFFHELKRHPENREYYEKFDGENEEEMAYAFSREYLEDENSPLYVDMSTDELRGIKQVRADFLKMLEKNKGKIKFDENIIAFSHVVTEQFYTEMVKHPENLHLLGEETDCLKKYIYGELYNPESKFFIDMSPSRPSMQKTIEAIHKAGGKAFLAHPGRYTRQFNVEREIEEGTILEGLDGIEVFYPVHDKRLQDFLLNICREKGLYASGGSDDHRDPKAGSEYKIGTIDVPEIPETKWIKDIVVQGKDYISEAEEMRELINRLRKLRKEKDEKEKVLSKIQEKNIGEQSNDREH